MSGEGFDLTGQVAIITGAGQGIGRAHALMLAGRGATVVVNDIASGVLGGDGRAARVVEEIRGAGGAASCSVDDVATAAGGRRLVADALDRHGRLDVLIHNAAIGGGTSFGDLDPELFNAVLAVNIVGALNVGQPSWRAMVAQGYGRVVLTTSSAVVGLPTKVPYCTAKAGLIGMARALKHEADLIADVADLKVNVVSPIASTGRADPAMDAVFGPGLLGPEAVAAVVTYLASPACRLNGEVLHAGAGHVARMFVGIVPGWAKGGSGISAEDVEAHLHEILDLEGATVPDSVPEVVRGIAARVLGDPVLAASRVDAWLAESRTGVVEPARREP